MKNVQIEALNKVGQSIWYDNCSRDVLNSGELKSLIAQGVSGLTSNPSIFKNAIANSTDYDIDIQKMSDAGSTPEEICESLMVQDVAAAADLLRPIYEESQGEDGYASIEVSPFLANDTDGTIAAARRLWAALDRPNGMIKIPATPEGIPAIKETLAAGVNVNVTLIFSTDTYTEVLTAFLDAIEKRRAQGESPLGIASVASFFVSRVDAICEKELAALVKDGRLQEAEASEYVGKIGIANSRVAYKHFQESLKTDRFQALLQEGVKPQRPLWASTGTKNPDFSPVLYVEELAGATTVNTLPPATLNAIMESGTIKDALHEISATEAQLLSSITKAGVPLDDLLIKLRDAGVKSFSDAYAELLDAIDVKRQRLAV